MRRTLLTACTAALLLTAPAPTAEPGEVRITSGPYTPVLKVSVQANLVEVGVTIRDPRGAAVAGLKAADFELLDDRKPQAITFFSEQKAPSPQASGSHRGTSPDAPVTRSIALFFDDTHAATYDIQHAKTAAEKLVSSDLQPGDRVAIFTESGTPNLDFTTDTKLLMAALDQLRLHHKAGPSSLGACPDFTPAVAFSIAHHLDEVLRQQVITQAVACNCPADDPDCISMQPSFVDSHGLQYWGEFKQQSFTSLDVVQVIVRHLATAPGSRMLVLFSPGYITGDMDRAKSSIVDEALRARIVIHAVNSAGLETMANSIPHLMNEFMIGATSATGGHFVQNNNDIPGGLGRALRVPDSFYILGFSPGPPDGKFHTLKVSMRRTPGHQIDARTGYFSTAAPPPRETAQERIDRIARSVDTLNEIASRATVTYNKSSDGKAQVQVKFEIDAASLRFVERDAHSVQQLTFVTVLEDSQGAFVTGKQSVMDLNLTPATLSELKANGLKTATSLSVPSGVYRVRTVIREAADNHISASRAPLQIP